MSRPSLDKLVNFVRWCQQEAREIGAMPESSSRDVRLAAFERRCADFDRLPEALKREAVDAADAVLVG